MISLNHLYWIANLWALCGWLVLFFYFALPVRMVRFAGIFMPLGLALAYLCAVIFALPLFSGGFGSLESLGQLYQHPVAVLVGWIHYLAFDLFIGGWQVRRAQSIGLPVVVVVPCLLLTLLFGPIGLLVFYMLQKWWPSNDQVSDPPDVWGSGR